MRWYVPVVIAVVAVVVLLFFVAFPLERQQSPARSLVISNEPVEQAIGTRVVVTSTYFYPDNYTIPSNNSLVLLFTSPGQERTLSIPGLGATVTIPADKDTPYTTPKLVAGSFVIYCIDGCDRNTTPMTVTIE